MDLLSSIRKSGSRGGVNFSWDDVASSSHRENYLGHSVKAPVGRWQKGKELDWYAKADDDGGDGSETTEERRARERKEEIRRIKEAEEDALDKALGRPVRDRGPTGANAISVGEVNRAIEEAGIGQNNEQDKGAGFGAYVGRIEAQDVDELLREPEKGGLMRASGDNHGGKRRRERSRGIDRDYRVTRREGRLRSRSRDRGSRDKEAVIYQDRERGRDRSRSPAPGRSRQERDHEHRRHGDQDWDERISRRHREPAPCHRPRHYDGDEYGRRRRRSASPEKRDRRRYR